MSRILITTSTFTCRKKLEGLETLYNPYGRRLSEEELFTLVQDFDPRGIIAGVEPVTRRVLEGAKSLKAISRCGTGLDSVDLEAAAQLGIAVRNTPNAPVSSVAEMTLALILGWLRRIAPGDSLMKAGRWVKGTGFLLSGKTVGILGCGRIGSRVAELLAPFGVRLIGYDPLLTSHPLCEMKSLGQVLKESDIISLHLPLTEDTRGMIGTEAFTMMKESALVVNTARGGIINEDELFTALTRGDIAGAALDVFEKEPYEGRLIELEDKVLLSPHQASSAREGRMLMEEEAVDNLLALLGLPAGDSVDNLLALLGLPAEDRAGSKERTKSGEDA